MTTTTFSTEPAVSPPIVPSERTLILRAFRQDKLAMLGVLVILFFVLTSIFAPLLTPYPAQGAGDPNIIEKFKAPAPSISWALTTWGATCWRAFFTAGAAR